MTGPSDQQPVPQAQAHETTGEKGGGGASASVGKGGGGASLSSSHRSLLNAALHAQAWLQSLLLSHDPQMLNENGQAVRECEMQRSRGECDRPHDAESCMPANVGSGV